MEYKFFMQMTPPKITHQQKRVGINSAGKPYFYESERLRDARNLLTTNLAKYIPPNMITHGIRLIVKWYFPATKRHKHGEYMLTRPDTDNLQKLLKDVMTDLHFWKDDALVCSEIVEKFYSDIPGIYISLEEIT